jgi:hypothetical protein
MKVKMTVKMKGVSLKNGSLSLRPFTLTFA